MYILFFRDSKERRLVEQTEAHVVIGLLLLLNLLLLSGGVTGSGGGTSGSSGSTTGGGGTDVESGEQLVQVLLGDGLGEQVNPDGLKTLNTGLGEDGVELVGGDLDLSVSENEGGYVSIVK